MLQIRVAFTVFASMIRELKWEDMDDIIRNYYSYYDEVEKENPDLGLVLYMERPDYASEIGWFTSLYRDVMSGIAKCLVAEEDSRVVGICDVHSKRPKSEIGHVGVLGLAIVKDYRGRGIGKALLEGMLKACRGTFEILNLDVLANNNIARELYRKVGFVDVGTQPKALKRNGKYYSEISMYIDLSQI